MAPFFARRPTQQVVIIGQTSGVEMDDPASHFDSLLGHGDPFTDPEAGSTSTSCHHQYHPDPDRRRNQYSYMNATTPAPSTSSPSSQPAPASSSSPASHQPATSIARSKSTRTQPLTQQNDDQQPQRRQKSYSLSGGPSWLMNNSLIEVRRQSSVTGERRESRKLQKEHPTGSARPNTAMAIEEKDKGSGLGVRRKMGKLRELYRK
ncbi:hypothetical protein VMCG_01858 [Cytospora schulzeri]|uniref:Uncharacterized protein n=1 Tax=Cytospora schulzeri TaxID=448051 RepID=A0A423X2P1_9PEZI|nr:hypothetical protein VMCG_01858 [Valsa malicola]